MDERDEHGSIAMGGVGGASCVAGGAGIAGDADRRCAEIKRALRRLVDAAEHYTIGSGAYHVYGTKQYAARDCPVCAAGRVLEQFA